MTAFVIDLRSDKISIGSDTLGYIVGVDAPASVAPIGFLSKVYTFPWIRAALFGRGMTAIGARAAAAMYTSPRIRSFADAMGSLPLILRQTTNNYSDEYDIDDPISVQLFEAFFCGYDAEARRMRVASLYNYRGEDGYELEELPPGTVGTMPVPQLPPEFAPAVNGLSLDKRLITGLHACRAYAEAHPERTGGAALVGGEIEMTEITAAGINVRTIGRFADYEQARNAGAAVLDRFARGDLAADVRDGLVRTDDMMVAGDAAPAPEAPAEVVAIAPGATRAERRRAEKLARQAGARAA